MYGLHNKMLVKYWNAGTLKCNYISQIFGMLQLVMTRPTQQAIIHVPGCHSFVCRCLRLMGDTIYSQPADYASAHLGHIPVIIIPLVAKYPSAHLGNRYLWQKILQAG